MTLQVENVTKSYGTQKALDHVSMELQKGEIVALLGPNGAGKSTLMKIITCYIPQSKGKVRVNGFDVEKSPLEVKKTVGYLPEHNPLYLDMYVKEYLEFVGGLHRLGEKTHSRVSEMIEKTGLTRERHKKIGALSKGYRQRVGIAQALIHDPEILILDEPTTGLDPNQIIEIRELIQEAGKEKTVLLSTHIMQEVQALCNRVVIINKGKIIADASTPDLQLLSQTGQTLTLEFENEPQIEKFHSLQFISAIQAQDQKTFKVYYTGDKKSRAEIFRFAAANNLVLTAMYPEDHSIEQVFRELTKEQQTL